MNKKKRNRSRKSVRYRKSTKIINVKSKVIILLKTLALGVLIDIVKDVIVWLLYVLYNSIKLL